MKASEALRLGSMRIPATGHGELSIFQRNPVGSEGAGEICAACALGTMIYAVGMYDSVSPTCITFGHALMGHGAWVERFPILGVVATHPARHTPGHVAGIISGLFEYHGWSRERIADWLETVEAQHEAQQARTQEVEQPAPEYAAV